MKINIFLDFAETIGYARYSQKEFDYKIIKSVLGSKFDILIHQYGMDEKEDGLVSIYSKKVEYKDIFEEKKYCLKYFKKILSKYCHKNEVDKLAKEIVYKKYSLCRHNLYPEVLDRLNDYIKVANIFILSDGKPSRRLSIKRLGISKYCKDCFISDEIGVLKNKTKFYRIVMSKIDIQGRIIFIDDVKENLDAFGRLCKIEKYLMNRQNNSKKLDKSYIHVSELPANF